MVASFSCLPQATRLLSGQPRGETEMAIFVIGGTGFIGTRVIRLLAARGEEIVCMDITAVRPANVTGPDKVRGSVDHVNVITQPAQGKPISFAYEDAMRCPIHVDDIAEVFTRILLADKPRHAVYSSGGVAISLGEIAGIVHEFLPDARISFEHETGGKANSGNYLIDNSRLVQEFGVQYLPYRQRVLQIINDIRREVGLPLVSG